MIHVVQPAETVALIAERYGSAVADVVAANRLDDPNVIYTGQVLTVPLPSAEAALAATPVLWGAQETAGVEPEPSLPAPTLVSPAGGVALSGVVELKWQGEQALEPGQYYAVYVWWDGQPAPCCLALTMQTTYDLDLQGHIPGDYRWSVRVVEGGRDGDLSILYRSLSSLAEPGVFTWSRSE